MFGKVLVANRGEIARRVFRACRRLGVRTVAVYSEVDRDAPHVTDADEALLIGPPPARESYLHAKRIIETARRCGAEAIHPGYGFLSENWKFAEACRQAGLTFIGPPPEAIRKMGDKTEARRLMAAAGVPVLPGSEGPVAGADEAARVAGDVGFPVILKAAAGGGGIGMARVNGPEELLFKVIAVGGSRAEALDRMAPALAGCVVEGVRTTIPFLRKVIEHGDVRAGRLDTQMTERGAFG